MELKEEAISLKVLLKTNKKAVNPYK